MNMSVSAKKMRELLKAKDPQAILAHAISTIISLGENPRNCPLWLARIRSSVRFTHMVNAHDIIEYLKDNGIHLVKRR